METSNTGSPAAAPPVLPTFQTSASDMAPSPSSASPCTSIPSSDTAPRLSPPNVSLAREASNHFHACRYHECLDVLQRLLLNDPDNPKMSHNIAVAECFRDGWTDPQKLLESFLKIKKRIEDISKHAKEQLDSASSSFPNSSSVTTPSSTKNVGGSTVDALSSEDYDTTIPTFNIAVVLYYLQQYTMALSVLEPLYQNIEPIDEPAALHICTLMLDITLAAFQFQKACDVLQYMEKIFGLGFLVTSDSGSNHAPHSTNLGNSDAYSIPVNGVATANSLVSTVNPEGNLLGSSSEEVLDDEALGLNFNLEGPSSAKSGASLSMLSNAVQAPSDRSSALPPRDPNVKILLHLNKVRLFLCTRNIKAAKREIKLAINLAQGSDLLKALMLKAQLEYSRGNHRKAMKLLITCSMKDPGLRYIVLNNLGCIHHYLGKDNTSYAYFVKALQCCTSIPSEKPLHLSTFSQNRSVSILYNCGLQQLKCGNPVLAAVCFQEVGHLYYRQPLFWIRLAECCIYALEKGLLEAGVNNNVIRKDELSVSCIGSGKWRTLVLPSGSLNLSISNRNLSFQLENGNPSTIGKDDVNDSLVFGKTRKLSLSFARQCLQNAKLLLGDHVKKIGNYIDDSKGEENISEVLKHLSISTNKNITGFQSNSNGNNKDMKLNIANVIASSVVTFKEEQQKRNSTILQYILADLAFVELCMDNPVSALKAARQLLKHPGCTKPFKFLGHMYAAEALGMLNRPRESLEELSVCMSDNNSQDISSSGGDEEGQQWKSGENSEASGEGDDMLSTGVGNSSTLSDALTISSLTGTRARASLFINLAMVHAMIGDLSQAQHFAMQSIAISPANPLAILSMVYVNLIQGRTQEAVVLLKHCRHLCIVGSGLH